MTQYLLFLGDYLTFNGDRLKIGVGVPPKPPLTIALDPGRKTIT